MKLIKDKRAFGVISFFIGAMVAVIIALQVAWPVIDQASTPEYATGAYTFSGNVSNGELVNFTNGASVYLFEFNTTGTVPGATCLTINCIRINATDNNNSRVQALLVTAINNNATVAGLVTAANSSLTVVLTADSVGKKGYTLSDNAANVASTGFSGGTYATSNMSSSSQTLINLIPLFLALAVLMIFIRPLL